MTKLTIKCEKRENEVYFYDNWREALNASFLLLRAFNADLKKGVKVKIEKWDTQEVCSR